MQPTHILHHMSVRDSYIKPFVLLLTLVKTEMVQFVLVHEAWVRLLHNIFLGQIKEKEILEKEKINANFLFCSVFS